jgi:hypothetical protein
MLDKELYDEIIRKFKGKGGGPESETILLDNKEEEKLGLVSVYAQGKNAAKIAARCWPAIVSARIDGEAVFYDIKRSAFRGIHAAFKIVREEK